MTTRLDPALADYLAAQPRVVWDESLDLAAERARERAESLAAPRLAEPAEIRDLVVPGPEGAPGIGARLYRPTGERDLPLTLYLHGGGFVVGGLETHDNAVRLLAEQARTVVVAADYRLAPEHTYPAAVDDAYAVYRWVLAEAAALGADPGRVAVAGDSAGGFLATQVAFMSAERGDPPPAFQLLIYPATGAGSGGTGRDAEPGSAGLRPENMDWYMSSFLGGYPAERLPAYFPPAKAPHPATQPPTFVLTAELDPLREDGAAYAELLREAGVDARWQDSPGLVHSFLRFMHAVPAARAAAQPAFDALRAALYGPGS
ncbi:alpha/beta hydrolase [Streptomonospora wellingtoniae]|uniref:Alpha/beta hydrolase n=1 Tax=Streptomonospora wellingtoniae TaxID=3075544 RepID=A0ABU2KZD2_9ACTN|nr:alpha/beta hydrolase [Streptomonospora sp. DSM 45055]MDT0304617.1 alpha/beta hydrolase [Streptomonospora sp. DSM 45055]